MGAQKEAYMTSNPRSTKDTNNSRSTAKNAALQADDYSIYLPMDGIRVSAPWRLELYDNRGALSQDDLSELKSRFSLPTEILNTLSQQVGYCLDIQSTVNLVEVNLEKAIERAATSLEEAARLAKRLEADAKKIQELISPLETSFARNEEHSAALDALQNSVNAAKNASLGLHDAIDLVIKTPGAAADMSPLDKRHVWDKRRQAVVETCCYAWLDAGRQLTFTTISDGSQPEKRQGHLIDFIQAIVAKVTDPTAYLPPETLRKDIDRLKKKLAAPDPLLMPPIEG